MLANAIDNEVAEYVPMHARQRDLQRRGGQPCPLKGMACFCLLAALGGVWTSPRDVFAVTLRKPAKAVLLPGDDPHRIAVKFRDGFVGAQQN